MEKIASTARVFIPPLLASGIAWLVGSQNAPIINSFLHPLQVGKIPSVSALCSVLLDCEYSQFLISIAWLVALLNSALILTRSTPPEREAVASRLLSFDRPRKLVVYTMGPLLLLTLIFIQVDPSMIEGSRGLIRERVVQEMMKQGVVLHAIVSLMSSLGTILLVFFGAILINILKRRK